MDRDDFAASEALQRLANTLKLAATSGEFTLYFVQCGLQSQQDRYIASLTRECARSRVTVLWLDLRERIVEDLQKEALQFVEQRFAGGRPEHLALAVTGLESSILLDNDEEHPAVLQVLNLAREKYPSTLPLPLTIWLSEAMMRKVQSASPDFWSWRAADPERFDVDPEMLAEQISTALAADRIESWSDAVARVGRLEYLVAAQHAADRSDSQPRLELLSRLGDAYRFLERYQQARRTYEVALQAAANPDLADMRARLLNKLGIVLRETGDFGQAEAFLLSYTQETQADPNSQAAAFNNLGLVYLDQGYFDLAEETLNMALDRARQAGSKETESWVLANLGLTNLRQDRVDEAVSRLEEARNLGRDLFDKRDVSRDLMNLGLAHYRLGNISEAVVLARAAIQVSDEAGDLIEAKRCRVQLASLLAQGKVDLGDFEPVELDAARWYAEALDIARRIKDDRDEFNILVALARLFEVRGEDSRAKTTTLYEEALKKAQELGDSKRELFCYAALIRASGRSEPDVTARLKDQAKRLLRSVGAPNPLVLNAWLCDAAGMVAAPPGSVQVGAQYTLCICEGDPGALASRTGQYALVRWEILPELVQASQSTFDVNAGNQGIAKFADVSSRSVLVSPGSGAVHEVQAPGGSGTVDSPPRDRTGSFLSQQRVSTPSITLNRAADAVRPPDRPFSLGLDVTVDGLHCRCDGPAQKLKAPSRLYSDLLLVRMTPEEPGQVYLDIRCEANGIPFDSRLTVRAERTLPAGRPTPSGPPIVLILGSLSLRRIQTLDSLWNELRHLGYLPFLGGLDEPIEPDLVQKLGDLAGMVHFAIADLTDLTTVPQALTDMIPILRAPIQPLVAADTTTDHLDLETLRRYPWVLPEHRYTDFGDLLARLNPAVILPAEAAATTPPVESAAEAAAVTSVEAAPQPNGAEELVVFTESSPIEPQLKLQLLKMLTIYQAYFRVLGFQSSVSQVTVDVLTQTPGSTFGFYDPGPHRIAILASAAADVDVLLRQYGHHVLFANGPININGASSTTVLAIESGLANYFCCSFKDDPVFARDTLLAAGSDPNQWSLDNRKSFSEIAGRPGSTLMDGTVWGGAFWEMRQRLGPDPVDRLLYRAWLDSTAEEIDQGNGPAFATKLVRLGTGIVGEQAEQIGSIFAERGLLLPTSA